MNDILSNDAGALITYYTDGSYDGYLTLLYEAFKAAVTPHGMLLFPPAAQAFFEEYRDIAPDEDKARTLENAIARHISEEARENIRIGWLSHTPDAPRVAFDYLKLGWKLKNKLDDAQAHPAVRAMFGLRQKVTFEAHRFKGYIRFHRLEGDMYYARIESDHFILPLLADHFADRYASQDFVIHDAVRSKAIVSRRGKWAIYDFDAQPGDLPPEDDMAFAELWKSFLSSLTIKSRVNYKLQRRFIPVRYRKNLVEFQ